MDIESWNELILTISVYFLILEVQKLKRIWHLFFLS